MSSQEPDHDGARIGQLKLHMPGLLRLLGESLYSTPRVAYRELVQNAHDACVRRRIETGRAEASRIDVLFEQERDRKVVVLRDDGAGLDREEIEAFLATVGRGKTAELRRMLEDGALGAELIGQFGVGLLAAFLVADRVEVVTRRHDLAAEEGLRWVCEGQQTYRIEPRVVARVGTEVRLRIRVETPELGAPAFIREVIGEYARFLEVPIFVAGSPAPVNARLPPWCASTHEGQARMSYDELAAEASGGDTPLAVVRLRPFDDPSLGRVALEGALLLPSSSFASLAEHGEAAVFIRRMMVTPSERELLPRWARFVRGLVDCPALSPTASREQVRRDAAFTAVQRAIEDQLLEGIRELARDRPEAWAAVVHAHEHLLKTWAATTRRLFDAVADVIEFDTTRGRMALPAYLEISGGTLYYFDRGEAARAVELLGESASRPVIDARGGGNILFLQTYAEARDVPIVRDPSREASMFEPVRRPSAALSRLAERFAAPGIKVRLSRFEPREAPAILVAPPGAEFAERARAAAKNERMPSGMRKILGDRAEALAGDATLHLNVASPLVQRLAEADPAAPRLAAAVDLVREVARLLSGDPSSPAETRGALAVVSASVLSLFNEAAPDAAPPLDPPLDPAWLEERAGLARPAAQRLAGAAATLRALIDDDAARLAASAGLPVAIVQAIQAMAREELGA